MPKKVEARWRKRVSAPGSVRSRSAAPPKVKPRAPTPGNATVAAPPPDRRAEVQADAAALLDENCMTCWSIRSITNGVVRVCRFCRGSESWYE